MKTLVTGSNGLLGKALQELCDTGDYYFTSRQECNLEDFGQTLNLMHEIRPNRIIHLAAFVGGVESNSLYPVEYFEKNMLINLNLFRAAQRQQINQVTAFASTCVFPDPADYPLEVASIHNGPPHPSNYGYAYAKRMLEVLGKAYSQQYGIKFNLLIPANMYGEGENWGSDSGHVIPALIKKISKAKDTGENFKVWGSGRAKREFIFASDVAKLTLQVNENLVLENPLIITNSYEIEIRELVSLLVKEMNFSGNVDWDLTKPEGQSRKPSSDAEFRRVFPNFEFTSIEEGLRRTVKSFLFEQFK